MRIYEFSDGETDWVAAENKKEAIEFYMREIELTRKELREYKIKAVPRSEWKNYNIIDTEGERDEQGNYPVLCNFEEAIKDITSPQIICTTAY